ncbi:restriction endonuclease subunit S [Ochrobactrum sp. MC-1LL]|uniref:restriction endonuclease subunit S n=1 Tax=Ochrobactrum sp. MC-1LL TaxID=2735351 RepID=UPI0014382E12|nr:restriction endonuclease subunit S [Ochrobactrum sp. MC-1LL]NKE74479.1 restriction endonuclease subunit S [Ochrobactrum sp. MC-1LL]
MLDGWKKASIGEIGRVVTGTTPATANPEYYGGEIPFVTPGDLGKTLFVYDAERTLTAEGLAQANALPPGAVLFTCIGTIGKSAIAGRALATNQQINAIICDPQKVDSAFVYYLLDMRAEAISQLAGAQTVPIINKSTFEDVTAPFPPLPEQRKIAEILRTWDEAIEKLEALRAAKLRRITSVRQRLFEAAYTSHNRLRRARDIFETVSERARPDLPLLAVMQDIGIVRRDELDRRVAMPDGDTSSYKVVRPGDFVISLRSFEGGLEYSTITGLVSPAYTVLRPITELVGDYYRHFFKSRSFVGRLDKLIFGIRDGKQIAFRDFGDVHIPAPPVSEQKAQTAALDCLEADLALENDRIEALTRQKRGLMQKLLTGEWRVSP